MSSSVSQLLFLAGNSNRSFSEFDSRLPDLVLQVHAAAAHNEHGIDTNIMPRLANHWTLALRNSEPHNYLPELQTLLKYLAADGIAELTLNPSSNVIR